MNRNTGLTLALAFAVTAAVRIPSSHAPSGSASVEGARSTLTRTPPRKPAAASVYRGGCTAYDVADEKAAPDENRGAAKAVLDKFFQTEGKKPTDLSAQTGLRYAIALAADPRHTNLSLVFDRQMAAVQQAAQDESYTYDSSWLPWQTEPASFPLLADQQAQEDLAGRREACPGLLLFRKSVAGPAQGTTATAAYDNGLVVLVVGEQPTGGINRYQWANAIEWLGSHASPKESDGGKDSPRTLRVLGPSFSGSLVSLGRALGDLYPAVAKPHVDKPIKQKQRQAKPCDPPVRRKPAHAKPDPSAGFAAKFPQARVFSGSVSDCASVGWFKQLRWPQVASSQGGTTSPSVVFGSFTENDDRQIYSLLSYLGQEGTKARDVAILSEDETAYSGGSATGMTADEKPVSDPCAFAYPARNHPVRLFFPRDISALRNAYEKESIFNPATPNSEHSAHTILQQGSDVSESSGQSDTIPAYSGHLTPIAQEGVLYGIVSYMRTHHTRYVLLRCSNPLDFLFLTRFFHRAYPEGRIVTVGADLLFRREIDTTEFRGVLALSNYPLLPRNQHWSMLSTLQSNAGSSPSGHAHRAFETPTVEGTYMAGRYLFSRSQFLTPCNTEPGNSNPCPNDLDSNGSTKGDMNITLPLKDSIPDYADPFWLHTPGEKIQSSHAPTWLSAVGRDGYWPVAVLNDTSTPRPKGDYRLLPKGVDKPMWPPSTMVRLASGDKNPAHYDLDSDGKHFDSSLRSKLPMAWRLCAALSLGLLCYQLLGILWGNKKSAGGLFSVFRRVEASSQDILLGINSALAAMLPVALLSICCTTPISDLFASADLELAIFGVLGILGLIGVAVALFTTRTWVAPAWFLGVLGTLGGLSAWMLHTVLFGKLLGEQANRLPLFYRLGHVTSGVSPLLPVLFLLLGLYLWSWHAMAGNVLLCNGRPVLPRLKREDPRTGIGRWYWKLLGNPVDATGQGGDCLDSAQTRISQKLGKRIVAIASPVSVPVAMAVLLIALLAGALVCFSGDLPLLSMEGRAFAVWLNLGLLLAFLLIAAEAARLFLTWIELRRLLSKLNRLPIRRTFACLRAIEASSLWGMSSSVQRVQYRFFSDQMEAARRLLKLTGSVDWEFFRDAVECGNVFDDETARKLSHGSRWNREIARPRDGATVSIRAVIADAVAEVVNRLLAPAWANEGKSLMLACSAGGTEEEGSALPSLPLSDDITVRTAEEFVSFQYIAFIQNILARMRTMMMSMVLLFVAVSMAISFYPFVPRTEIGMWKMVNLALIGAAVVYVYAGMDRDTILSYIGNTKPGKLSADFWLKTAAFLAGPVVGILTTQFPAVADSVLAWLQPGLDTIAR